MVTTQQAQANLEAAIASKSDVESQAKEAMGKGDLAQVMKLGGDFQKAEAAIGKAEREITTAGLELSKGERDSLSEQVAKGIVARRQDIAKAIAQGHLLLVATRTGENTGFDDFLIKVGLDENTALSGIIHDILIEIDADSVTSAKRIRVDGVEVSVDPVVQGRAPKAAGSGGGSGGGGKGFDKDGVHLQLQGAFDQCATAEEVAHLGTLSGSNPTYSYKKKVVLAAGFTQT